MINSDKIIDTSGVCEICKRHVYKRKKGICGPCMKDMQYLEEKKRIKEEKRKKRFGIYYDADINQPYNPEIQNKIYDKIKKKYMSYYFYGKHGTYKTNTLFAILNYYLQKEYKIKYDLFYGSELLEKMKQYELKNEGFSIDYLYDMKLDESEVYYLLWDDIDKFKKSDFNSVQLFKLFDYFQRNQSKYYFIMTSNIDYKQFCSLFDEQYGVSIARRLYEKCDNGNNIVEFV